VYGKGGMEENHWEG